jgi:hypothetical protein
LRHLLDCPELRFAASCTHPTGARLPSLIAAVRVLDGVLTGVQRVYLRPDGSGLAAIEPQRAALGRIQGAAIRLAPLEDAVAVGELVVAETIEEAASLGRLLRRPAWAAATEANLGARAGIVLPQAARRVVIAATPGDDSAARAWCRFRAESRRVRITSARGGAL